MLHNCDLCGNADNFLSVPGDPSGKISICGQCGFVLVRERRSVQEVAQSWAEIYEKKIYDPQWPGVQARLFYVAAWLDANIGLAGRSVLDIGSGDGSFLDFCRSRGAYPVGLDPSDGNVRKVRQGDISCFRGWAADSSPDLGQYDIVTLNWTLENTADCLEVLRYAKRQLAPNGHVVVATGSRILTGFRKPLRKYLPQDPDYPHDTHCFRWSPAHLGMAAIKLGASHAMTNDYNERDELIFVFRFVDNEPMPDVPQYAAQAIQDHFRRWQEQYP